MAVRFLARDVSDLCVGKPPVRSLLLSATAAEALAALKSSGESSIAIWSFCESKFVGRICMVDLICFLCKEENLSNPSSALRKPISIIVSKKEAGVVHHLDRNSSLLEAIDCILEGAQNLIIPIKSNKTTASRKKHLSEQTLSWGPTFHEGHEYCWLTQEDVVRFLLNSIGVFSPLSTLTVESLNIVSTGITTIHFDDTVSSAMDSVTRSLIEQKPIAIVDEENKLIGEISPYALACCDETVAAAMATLSAGDLMAFIDYGGPEDLVHLVQTRLEENNLAAMVELMEEHSPPSLSSSTSCSSEEEFGLSKSGSGWFSPARKSEAIVCYRWSSLVAVMVQALAHRVNYVWVIEEDHSMVGIVMFSGILAVFRDSVGTQQKHDMDNSCKQ